MAMINNQKQRYKKYADKLTKVKFLSKQSLYEKEFKEAQQDTRKT